MPASLNNFFKVFDNIVTTIPSVVGEKIISLNFYNPKVEDLPPIKYHRDEERFKQKYSDKLDRFFLSCTVDNHNKKKPAKTPQPKKDTGSYNIHSKSNAVKNVPATYLCSIS